MGYGTILGQTSGLVDCSILEFKRLFLESRKIRGKVIQM